MKRILRDLGNHIREDFNPLRYGAIFIFLMALIILNYGFEVEFRLLAKLDNYQYLGYYLVLYPAVFYIAAWMKSGSKAFRQKDFWLLSLIYLFILAFSSGFAFHREWTATMPVYERAYARNLLFNTMGALFTFIPLWIVYGLWERKNLPNFYGLSFKKHDFRPYLWLIAMMAVPIAWAATTDDFLATYPTLKVWRYEPVWGLTRSAMMGIYEFFYLTDFIRVETIFRGALIIGLARFLGRDSIMVMATIYCVLHFNKPIVETISSFFGGYLLGTIAYYQRNIVGGCIVHAGIAALMEIAATVAHGLM